MDTTATLYKLHTELASPVRYSLRLGESCLPLNPYLGQPLRLVHDGTIRCIHCARLTKKSFDQGYCYPCFIRLAQCDTCIVRPELCHYAAGTCREPDWGEAHCLQPHVVYLANSSGLKVGVTRQTQVPTRWIDQGARAAIPVWQTRSRYLAGRVEVACKSFVADKTNWQRMLKSEAEPIDLRASRTGLLEQTRAAIGALQTEFGADAVQEWVEAVPIQIDYPILHYPAKVQALSFDKNPELGGILQGIKGQYLLFDTGVLNIRKFAGYQVRVA